MNEQRKSESGEAVRCSAWLGDVDARSLIVACCVAIDRRRAGGDGGNRVGSGVVRDEHRRRPLPVVRQIKL